MKLTIGPLTPDLWPALEDLFGKTGACNGCWCIYWRIGSAYRNVVRGSPRVVPGRFPHDFRPDGRTVRPAKPSNSATASRSSTMAS